MNTLIHKLARKLAEHGAFGIKQVRRDGYGVDEAVLILREPLVLEKLLAVDHDRSGRYFPEGRSGNYIKVPAARAGVTRLYVNVH